MALQGATPAGDGGVVPLRIERGAEVFATDGALGTVEQVVMNQQTHELQAIVVRPMGATRELLIGVGHVARAGENLVHLDFSKAQMAADPTLAQPYNPAGYVPVAPEAGMPREEAARIAERVDQPVVSGLEPDAVEVMTPTDQIRPETPGPEKSPPSAGELSADWRVPGNIASVAPRPLNPPRNPPSGRETQQRRESTEMANSSKSTGKTTSDRALETPQAPSAQQEAQRIAYNPASAAYLGNAPSTTTPTSTGGLPSWVMPVAIGAGTAAVVAGTTFGVLAWRRTRRPTGLDWWRWQLQQLTRDPQRTARATAQTLQRSAQSTMNQMNKQVGPELAHIATIAADQADGWREMLGEQFGAWRDEVGGPAVRNAKKISKNVSKNLPNGLGAWAAVVTGLVVAADKAMEGWRDALGNQLDSWRGNVSSAIEGNSKSLSKSLSRSAKQITRGPRRAVTRAVLSMRWFRRGIFFGMLGGGLLGLFLAPVPGSELRLRLWNLIQRLGGQVQSTVATAQANLPGRTTITPTTGAASTTSTGGTTGMTTGTGSGTTSTSKTTRPTGGSSLSETSTPR